MALTLRRKAGEAIKIGNDIIITIGETRGSYTNVRVDAPREIPIQRIEGEANHASKARRTRK